MEDVNQSKTAVTAARSATRKPVGTPALENLKNSKKKKKKLPVFDIQPHNLKIHLKTSCRSHPGPESRISTSLFVRAACFQSNGVEAEQFHIQILLFHYKWTYMESTLHDKEFMKLTTRL